MGKNRTSASRVDKEFIEFVESIELGSWKLRDCLGNGVLQAKDATVAVKKTNVYK